MVAFANDDLVNRKEVIAAWFVEINNANVIAFDAAVGATIFDLDAIAKPFVKLTITRDRRGAVDACEFSKRLVQSVGRDFGVQLANGVLKA